MSDKKIPTERHLKWHEAEMGVLIHYDILNFEPEYDFRKQWGYVPPVEKFNPTMLETDQWISAAASAGAKYAVMVVKHCTGFALWPTKAYPYSVAQSPWRDGKGDIIKDFLASCKKFGLLPGLYFSTSCNAYFNVDNPGVNIDHDDARQREYNRAVEIMADEIWGGYGELFEIWFDGGVLPPEKGGPDIINKLIRLQPNAVCFQGPEGFPNLVRWGANEEGVAPDPCWGLTDMQQPSGDGGQGQCPLEGAGRPDGTIWAPVEADMTIRRQSSFGGGWFWKEGEDHTVFTVEHLMDKYDKTVGRGVNLLLGMVVDTRGLIPEADVRRLAEFGAAIRADWSEPLRSTVISNPGAIKVCFDKTIVDRLSFSEEIKQGQLIRAWSVYAYTEGGRLLLTGGESVGHKRIVRFQPVETDTIELVIEKADGDYIINSFNVYKNRESTRTDI